MNEQNHSQFDGTVRSRSVRSRRLRVVCPIVTAILLFASCASDGADTVTLVEGSGADDVGVASAAGSGTDDIFQASDEAIDIADGIDTASTDGGDVAGVGARSAKSGDQKDSDDAGGLVVDAPVGGVDDAIEITVPSVPVEVADPVAAYSTSFLPKQIKVRLVERSAIDVTTELPGEVGGPAVLVGVEFTNKSGGAVDLSSVTVNMEYGPDDVPVGQVTTPPADPFSGSVAAGERQVGRYVFTLPVDERDDVNIYVSYSTESPVASFKGKFPRV